MGASPRCVPNPASTAQDSSRQSSTKCLWIKSSHADDQMHFTLIRQENCDSKKPGQRPSMACDSVPQGRLSRSEWRTVDPVAQRSGLFFSTDLRQTFMPARLDDVASREAVKFNDYANPVAASEHPFAKSVIGNSGSAICYPSILFDVSRDCSKNSVRESAVHTMAGFHAAHVRSEEHTSELQSQ